MPKLIADKANLTVIRWLTYLMFLVFAMTTDAVGSVIPKIVEEFQLSLKAASAFQYVTMGAIATGAIFLGFVADRYGRKLTVVSGLMLYGCSSLLFAFGNRYAFFVFLLACSGLGVSVFKVGALALIGDISRSTSEHTSLMNRVEGFFAVGAIIGPAIVALLLGGGWSWKYLYVFAACICALLTVAAIIVRYPPTTHSPNSAPASFANTVRMMRNPYARGFSLLIMLYVSVEVAIYVWMPTYLTSYHGPAPWLASYALTIFFVLRAVGRFLGAWLLRRCAWSSVLMWFALAILACFGASLYGGVDVGAYMLPLSGLFMSVIYPTLNSKGISCFAKQEHGAIAGVILFFTACAAAGSPLAMAAISDAFGDIKYGFVMATIFAALLAGLLTLNTFLNPAARRLHEIDELPVQT